MEHEVHSFGQFGTIDLISSFFASRHRFGRYLLFMYVFAWACLTELRQRGARLYLSLVVLIGILISGSREALVLFLFFHALVYGIKSGIKLLAYVGVISVIALALVFQFSSGYTDPDSINLLLRVRFFISSSEDWLNRTETMFLTGVLYFFSFETGVLEWIAGNGIGTYGQETRLMTDDRMVASVALPPGLAWIVGVTDSGLVKIAMEMGVLGLLAFALLQANILGHGGFLFTRGRKDPFYIASFLAVTIWLVLALKGRSMFSDQMANGFYWFYVGVLVRRYAVLRHKTRVADTVEKAAPFRALPGSVGSEGK